MSTAIAAPGRLLARKGIIAQLGVGSVLILVTLLFWPYHLIGTILGVIAFVIPHSIFAYWLFRYAGATKNEEVARSLSQGMKIKLALTTLIFVIAFATFATDPRFVLGAYAITMVSQWAAMFFLRHMS